MFRNFPRRTVAALTTVVALSAAIYVPTFSLSGAAKPDLLPAAPDRAERALVLMLSHADQDEVAMSRGAMPTLQDPDVKRFAQLMIDDHTTGLVGLTTIASRLGYPLASRVMNAPTARGMSDTQFITAQVAGHQELLGKLPDDDHGITDRGLRDHLTDTRKIVRAHLERAKELQVHLVTKTS